MAGNCSPRNVPKGMRSLTSPSAEDRDSTAARVCTYRAMARRMPGAGTTAEPLLSRGARRAALRRLRELAALEQQLAQAEQPSAPLLERGGRRAGDLAEGGGEAVECLRRRSRGSWSGTRR